jgi:hypothetical protein
LESSSWNDLTNTGDPNGDYQPKGYIVEYGGTSGDPVLKIAASTTITIAQITNIVSSTRCRKYHSSSNCRRRNNTLVRFCLRRNTPREETFTTLL